MTVRVSAARKQSLRVFTERPITVRSDGFLSCSFPVPSRRVRFVVLLHRRRVSLSMATSPHLRSSISSLYLPLLFVFLLVVSFLVSRLVSPRLLFPFLFPSCVVVSRLVPSFLSRLQVSVLSQFLYNTNALASLSFCTWEDEKSQLVVACSLSS